MSYYDGWGLDLLDLGEMGAASMERALRAIGLKLDEVPGLPIDLGVPPRERFRQGLELLRANILGPGGPLDSSPEKVALLFELTRQRADTRHVPANTIVQ